MPDPIPPKATGLKRIINATGYSMKGIASTWQSEAAFRQEMGLLATAIPLAFWVGENALETALLIASVLLVLVVELLNSAIESVIDRIGNDYHSASGKAKDQGSAAVLLALVVMATIWAGVLFH